MCRIAGVVNPALPTAALQAIVKEMCSLLKHGGPDDEGFYTSEEEHLVLGHRRLSLIDLSACGHQPMPYADGRYQLTYNGELYNYKELKKELQQAGRPFTTVSDTEVILAAFAEWGTNSFARFNGMFAFALWDNEESKLFLVRDPSGVKPLYYALTKHGLAFASEARAFQSIAYLGETNPDWPVYLLAYGHLPEPVTKLKSVQPLPKGSWLSYNTIDQSSKQETFASFQYSDVITDRTDAIKLVKYMLGNAVKSHLISDAPIGVFLSGGLDSSILASLANSHEGVMNTISIYFEEPKYSEKKFQDLLIGQLKCNHYQHLVSEADFHECLSGIINSMDLPSCDGINTWFISRYAKQNGLKAVLSGIGADELFGGYPSFTRINAALALRKVPYSMLRAGRHSTYKQLRRLAYLSIPGPVGQYLFLRGQFTPTNIAEQLGADEKDVWEILEAQPVLLPVDNLSPANQASWLEMNLYMQNQLLRDADVMSMAHGVEIRVPFLDIPFQKLAQRIDSNTKYKGALGKQLLIDAFKEVLPEVIWNRPKMGFSFPFKKWLSHPRYQVGNNANGLAGSHRKLQTGELHWSQFFTLLLMENPSYA
ncbi:MAG: asparagine synthase (glutamine-hydrolyzing) [Ferruginibacter sp.]|nr:asparagine synthase (glutamine-hydrolyzing) [Ferruginibacter sp.]